MKHPSVLRRLICICISAVFAFYFLIMDSKSRGPPQPGTLQNELQNAQPQIKRSNFSSPNKMRSKVILLWSPLFSHWNFLQEGKNSFRNCFQKRCEITSNRSRIHESDAILFHVRTMSLMDLPRIRSPHQKWTFFSLEAPPYSYFYGYSFMENMFNWTMTYRSDSDVVIRYGRIFKTNTSDLSGKRNGSVLLSEWKKKSRIAVWMVSHCSTSGNREAFVRKLEEYVDVTTFGECGIAVCQFNKTAECLENFSKKFHFYLSFENAICDDYVTEKFFRVVGDRVHMIPVVFGGGVYASIAPPHSYIDALSFESVEALAVHLREVASDFSLFSSYFEWRLDGYVVEDLPSHCMLCEKLHSGSFHESTSYADMSAWWVEKSHCRKWEDHSINT